MSISIVATAFPAISLVLGFLAVFAGQPIGWLFVGIGVISQGAWLVMK